MKTLSDFKKRLKVGTQIETMHAHLGSFGIRKVSKVQTNSFALETLRDNKIVDSWCEYPKSKDFEIVNENTAKIFWGEGAKREHILTYTFLD